MSTLRRIKKSSSKNTSPKREKREKLSDLQRESESPSKVDNGASWMLKGEEAINQAHESQKLLQKSKNAPELFVRQGEEKTLRFRSSAPLGAIFQYTLNVNGKWRKFTAPDGRDLFAENGLRKSLRDIWEVIDVDGYVDKEGKTRKNLPRFLVSNYQLSEVIKKYASKMGSLINHTWELSRSGTGTSTTYTIMPIVEESYDYSKVEKIGNEVTEYYAPPSLQEQQAVMNRYAVDNT